jgi:hypothetical protein
VPSTLSTLDAQDIRFAAAVQGFFGVVTVPATRGGLTVFVLTGQGDSIDQTSALSALPPPARGLQGPARGRLDRGTVERSETAKFKVRFPTQKW